MIIQQIKYIIVERNDKILFHQYDGQMTEYFNEVEMYDTKEHAQELIDTFDAERTYEIMPVKVECSI